MNDILFNTQQAVVNALTANADIKALVGDPPRLYDHAPADAVFPFIVFGETQAAPYDYKVETGFAQIVTLDIYSRYRGGREAKDIFQAAYAALHRATLAVTGSVFLNCEFHSADVALEGDGLTTHAAMRFSIITQNS